MKRRTAPLWLLLLAAAGCDRKERPSGAPPVVSVSAVPATAAGGAAPDAALAPSAEGGPAKGPGRPLNVILLTIDSLRADMPWTGYERKIAPNLTRLADKAVVYENAYSPSSYTAQSVATYLSGRWPSTLYRQGWFFTGYSKENTFFPEVLQQQGIRTLSWHAHLYFGRGKGLEQGFDVWELVPGITFNPNTDEHITSEKMTKLGIEILGKPDNTGKQFFAWAHYMDPHDEYKKHPEADFGNKNRDRYDSEVFHTDDWIAKLLEFCEKQPWWKDTAVIVSADHGEAFGEHNVYKHAFDVWEVLVRVPLLVHAPGIKPRRISARRSNLDLSPTILELLGQKPLETFMGKSLVSELYGAEPDDREPILVELTEDSHNPPRRGLIKGDYKLMVWGKGNKYLLFNLSNDPGEKTDVSKTEPEAFAKMKALYAETFGKLPSVEPYGGMKLKEGGSANGPMGPAKKP